MRKYPLPIVIFSLALGFVCPAFLRAGAPVIDSAQADFSAHTLLITGADFGSTPPTVTLGATALTVTAFSPTSLRATLPAGWAAGSYHLRVATATTPPGIAALDVTIGTVGPIGPQGEAGPAGPMGP